MSLSRLALQNLIDTKDIVRVLISCGIIVASLTLTNRLAPIQKDTAILNVQLSNLQKSVDTLIGQMRDLQSTLPKEYITQKESEKEFFSVRREIENLDHRIDRVETFHGGQRVESFPSS